ncbi:TPA: N-acetyltransferase [Providencia stuartii]|nr:GNAT family protein [Providencia stuartii]MBN5561574.1 GNAT family N-acetyltransferase [Providencia stuartii]MBN5601273.1 GNAT family N-acetyltransferase [Providencia stuartii]MBN5605299.1 GNAT family N-acetyltransferase [Providencia stuartii]QUC26951.1 GNAT family N-acetyltransferase [Providencia stuartii]TPW74364.1 GNAT family N-acetyltransferase [Providencia stuartii]
MLKLTEWTPVCVLVFVFTQDKSIKLDKMNIQLQRLSQINCHDIIALNTHPLVLAHMPLGDNQFDETFCKEWVKQKEQHWQTHGFGVWALTFDGVFGGWGGFQDENGDADLALVLHPDYWGYGKNIAKKIVEQAAAQLSLTSITIHLPLSRKKLGAIRRYGFIEEGEVDFDGVAFKRFRLKLSSLMKKKPC